MGYAISVPSAHAPAHAAADAAASRSAHGGSAAMLLRRPSADPPADDAPRPPSARRHAAAAQGFARERRRGVQQPHGMLCRRAEDVVAEQRAANDGARRVAEPSTVSGGGAFAGLPGPPSTLAPPSADIVPTLRTSLNAPKSTQYPSHFQLHRSGTALGFHREPQKLHPLTDGGIFVLGKVHDASRPTDVGTVPDQLRGT